LQPIQDTGNRRTDIAPSASQCVGSANNFLGEHSACPVLAHDKGAPRNSNEEAKNDQTEGVVDQSCTGGGNGSRAEDEGAAEQVEKGEQGWSLNWQFLLPFSGGTYNKTRAPYTSQRGPRMKRIKIVPPTPAILEVHISSFVRPSSSLMAGRRGETANQMKKAMKNDLHIKVIGKLC